MFKCVKLLPVGLLFVVLAGGCREGATAPKPVALDPALAGERAKYLLEQEPAGGKGVLDVRKDTQDGDEVVVVGRVGGSKEPLGKGRAYFTIVDPSFIPCNEKGDDPCRTPWDYCCDSSDDVARASALIKFTGTDDKPLPWDADRALGVQPLQTVVVRGKAKRDDSGNLTVLAEGLYIRPSLKEARP